MSSPFPQIRFPVSLRRLFPSASFVGCADIRVADATESSRECNSRTLFAAIPGTRMDGMRFVGEAVERGAPSLLVGRPLADVSLPQCVVPNPRKSYAELCAALAGSPSTRLKIAAVTGTNGKTTVSWLIRSVLQAAGLQTGLVGTIEYSDGRDSNRARLTTPDSKSMSQWLSAMVARRTTHASVELSSHALDQDRIGGTEVDVAVVTNITQDHFDYHRDYDSYCAAKAKVLELIKNSGLAVLNADDPKTAELAGRVPSHAAVQTYGLDSDADITAAEIEISLEGSRFVLRRGGECVDVCTPLVGLHNISNCLAAAASVAHFGLSLQTIAEGIESLASVPGRLERLECGQDFDVFVDYAHTDDALKRSIDCLQHLTSGRLICVFGAGGDRDRTKRPLLGRAAAGADLAVVTSDNPRTEDPNEIIRDILGGFPPSSCPPHVEADRAAAIHWALEQAEPGDCVLIAGKGHETEQIVGSTRIPFDDREVVRDALRTASHAAPSQPLKIPA